MSTNPNAHPDPFGQTISIRCGHCKDRTSAVLRGYTDKRGDSHTYTDDAFAFVRCLSCDKGNMIRLRANYSIGYIIINQKDHFTHELVSITEQWPKPPKPKTLEHLPAAVKKTYDQAEAMFAAGFHSPAATEFRKAIEMSVKSFSAEGGNLYKKIKWMEEERIITPALKDWAHEVRGIGNEAVHDEPLPNDRAKIEAEDARAFTEMFLTTVFTMAEKIKTRRQRTEDALNAIKGNNELESVEAPEGGQE